QKLDRALNHIEVRRKVRLVGHNGAAARPSPEGGHDELEQVHRRGIRDDHIAGGRPHEGGELGTDPLRRIEPAIAPPADEPPAPPPRVRPPPPSRSTPSRTRGPACLGSRPSELPSRYTRRESLTTNSRRKRASGSAPSRRRASARASVSTDDAVTPVTRIPGD